MTNVSRLLAATLPDPCYAARQWRQSLRCGPGAKRPSCKRPGPRGSGKGCAPGQPRIACSPRNRPPAFLGGGPTARRASGELTTGSDLVKNKSNRNKGDSEGEDRANAESQLRGCLEGPGPNGSPTCALDGKPCHKARGRPTSELWSSPCGWRKESVGRNVRIIPPPEFAWRPLETFGRPLKTHCRLWMALGSPRNVSGGLRKPLEAFGQRSANTSKPLKGLGHVPREAAGSHWEDLASRWKPLEGAWKPLRRLGRPLEALGSLWTTLGRHLGARNVGRPWKVFGERRAPLEGLGSSFGRP